MAIGFTPVHRLLTIPVGPHQKAPSRFTTHVQPVGVFPTVAAMVSGQRPVLTILPTTAQTKVYRSVSVLLQLRGTQLRVIAATIINIWTLSATVAAIGLRRLIATKATSAPTTCTSATMATSIRADTTIARTVTQSVASKNQNNLISVVRKPKRKQGFLDNAF